MVLSAFENIDKLIEISTDQSVVFHEAAAEIIKCMVGEDRLLNDASRNEICLRMLTSGALVHHVLFFVRDNGQQNG